MRPKICGYIDWDAFRRDRDAKRMQLKVEWDAIKQVHKTLDTIEKETANYSSITERSAKEKMSCEKSGIGVHNLIASFKDDIRELSCLRRDVDKMRFQNLSFTPSDGQRRWR